MAAERVSSLAGGNRYRGYLEIKFSPPGENRIPLLLAAGTPIERCARLVTCELPLKEGIIGRIGPSRLKKRRKAWSSKSDGKTITRGEYVVEHWRAVRDYDRRRGLAYNGMARLSDAPISGSAFGEHLPGIREITSRFPAKNFLSTVVIYEPNSQFSMFPGPTW